MGIVCNVNHVIRVDCAKGSETVADDCKEGDENVVNDIDDVELFAADIDPTWVVKLGMKLQARSLPIRKRTQARPKRVMRVA